MTECHGARLHKARDGEWRTKAGKASERQREAEAKKVRHGQDCSRSGGAPQSCGGANVGVVRHKYWQTKAAQARGRERWAKAGGAPEKRRARRRGVCRGVCVCLQGASPGSPACLSGQSNVSQEMIPSTGAGEMCFFVSPLWPRDPSISIELTLEFMLVGLTHSEIDSETIDQTGSKDFARSSRGYKI
jgi:hypothetical protein